MSKALSTIILLVFCTAACAATAPLAKKTIVSKPQTLEAAAGPAMDNPFITKIAVPAISAKEQTLPKKKKIPLVELERAFVLRAFLDYGTEVGSVNGKTVFRLKKHYLFLNTTPKLVLWNLPHTVMQEQELPPPIPAEAQSTAPPEVGSGPRNTPFSHRPAKAGMRRQVATGQRP